MAKETLDETVVDKTVVEETEVEVTDEVTEEVTDEAPALVQPPAVDPDSPEGKLDALHVSRMGSFKVSAAYSEVKYFKNILNKIEWTGSNEAYLVALSSASLDSTLSMLDPKALGRVDVELPAAVIEALNFFLGKVTGKGKEGANRLFAATMLLRQAVLAITQLQEEINVLTEEIKNSKKSQ